MNGHARARTETVAEALWGATQARSKGAQRTRGALRLVLTEEPRVVAHRATGEPVGVELWVELYENGQPVDIDPHRVIVNPPTRVVAAPEERDEAGNVTRPRETLLDPLGALWDVLWASVESHPSPETKARPRKVAR